MAERRLAVLVESGAKKTFASAVEWPGWSRGAKDEAAALEALVDYGRRYKRSLGAAAKELEPPSGVDGLDVVERIPGNSGTDFGIPTSGGKQDERALRGADLDRLERLLQAAWRAFDKAADSAEGVELAKGPRGGGRDLAKITEHVLGGEEAYLHELAGSAAKVDAGKSDRMKAVRDAAIDAVRRRARGEEPEKGPRRTKPFWTPRYFVRRSAWHVLDHAWEIEDRSEPDG